MEKAMELGLCIPREDDAAKGLLSLLGTVNIFAKLV